MTTAGKDHDFTVELAGLESAEDFLEYFDIAFDPGVVRVSRLHILQRFHDYLARMATTAEDGIPDHATHRAALARAYDDFVRSSPLDEKVFRVHQRAAGIATIPLSAIGRAGR